MFGRMAFIVLTILSGCVQVKSQSILQKLQDLQHKWQNTCRTRHSIPVSSPANITHSSSPVSRMNAGIPDTGKSLGMCCLIATHNKRVFLSAFNSYGNMLHLHHDACPFSLFNGLYLVLGKYFTGMSPRCFSKELEYHPFTRQWTVIKTHLTVSLAPFCRADAVHSNQPNS